MQTAGAVRVRELGSRGSRVGLGPGDPTGVSPAVKSVLGGVSRWWAERATRVGLRGAWEDVSWAIGPAPVALQPTTKGDLSGPSEILGEAYIGALTTEVRARHGRHFTPPSLAHQLWLTARRALGLRGPSMLPGTVRDPACGAGALLLPALRDHLRAVRRDGRDPTAVLAELPQLIQGTDLDPVAVWLANVALAAECLPFVAAAPAAQRRPLPEFATVGDGLDVPAEPATAVVMNPPYGRVRLDDDERARWSHATLGHANLYGLFLAAGIEQLADGGAMAALIPTSFMAGNYFQNLRSFMVDSAPLREVTFVEARSGVFAGVLQETCLAAFAPGANRSLTQVGSLNGRRVQVARVPSPANRGPWLLPRRKSEASLAATASKLPSTLAAAGWSVSTGPLVWNRRKADLGSRRSGNCVPVVWAADIDGGVLHQDPARDLVRWLKLTGNDERVLVLDEPALFVQRTTAPEQSRRLVVAELGDADLDRWGGRVVVENHVNVLRPCPVSQISRQLLHGLLRSDVMDRVLRCISGSVAVSAYEMEALPLPDAVTLASWEGLRGNALDQAIRSTYGARP